MSSARRLLFCALLFAPVLLTAPAATRVSTEQPVLNFRLPFFTPEGNRAWIVRGREGRLLPSGQVEVRDLDLTIFKGNAEATIETVLVSPLALVTPESQTVSGTDSLRVIGDDYEASGSDWHYENHTRHITLRRDVRVVFRAQLEHLLQ